MRLENILRIDAPLDVVWQVTEDVERWPEWTPTVTAARRLDQGPFDVGSTALLTLPRVPESTWTVTSLTRGERFSWETQARGTRMIATHEMTPIDARHTQSLVRIEMIGPIVTLLWPVFRFTGRRLLEQENAGLKRRCEALSRADRPVER